MRATRTEIAGRLERIERKVNPRACRCGVEHLAGARAIAIVYGEEPAGTTCPACGLERLVIRLHSALEEPGPLQKLKC